MHTKTHRYRVVHGMIRRASGSSAQGFEMDLRPMQGHKWWSVDAGLRMKESKGKDCGWGIQTKVLCTESPVNRALYRTFSLLALCIKRLVGWAIQGIGCQLSSIHQTTHQRHWGVTRTHNFCRIIYRTVEDAGFKVLILSKKINRCSTPGAMNLLKHMTSPLPTSGFRSFPRVP